LFKDQQRGISMDAKPVSESQVHMTEMVLPSHINSLGSIFGGVIMSWIDIAGAICAQRHSHKAVVTASIDALNFVAPVYKGWIVNLKASVNFASTTSMEVGVRVDAENPITGEMFHTATAYLTFVALDSHLKPTPVPKLLVQTADEKRRYEAAQKRRAQRLEAKQALRKK
jgi:acyl-CoA hydrolase